MYKQNTIHEPRYNRQMCNHGMDCFSRNCQFKHPKGRDKKLLDNFINHNIENNPNFRTQLCIDYSENLECSLGYFCRFAHGEEQLRNNSDFEDNSNNVSDVEQKIYESSDTPTLMENDELDKLNYSGWTQDSLNQENDNHTITQVSIGENNNIITTIEPNKRLINIKKKTLIPPNQLNNSSSSTIKDVSQFSSNSNTVITKSNHLITELEQEKHQIINRIIELESRLIELNKSLYRLHKL
jgi:hypothetical protein